MQSIVVLVSDKEQQFLSCREDTKVAFDSEREQSFLY